jgi:hypothetical protein
VRGKLVFAEAIENSILRHSAPAGHLDAPVREIELARGMGIGVGGTSALLHKELDFLFLTPSLSFKPRAALSVGGGCRRRILDTAVEQPSAVSAPHPA